MHKIATESLPKRIYNPIAAIEFFTMFFFQLNNTKRWTYIQAFSQKRANIIQGSELKHTL